MIFEKEDIQEAYEKLQKQIPVYKENKQYVKGANPTILKAQRRKDPDNRLPIPLAKASVEDQTGYAGANIKIYFEETNDNEKGEESKDLKEYRNFMHQVNDFNDDDLITTELYMEALSQRETYLLLWPTNNMNLNDGLLTPEWQVCGMDTVVLYWSKSLKPEITAAVRFVEDEDSDDIAATVYYPGEEVKEYSKNEKEEIIIKRGFSQEWKRTDKGDWTTDGQQNPYPFMKVPIAVFKIAKDGGPLFQAEKTTIDSIDETISKSQNEIDRFNALVALFPGKVTKEFVKELEEKKIIDELDEYERWPEYLEKSLAGVAEYTNNHLDRLERFYHKTIKVVDFNQIAAEGGDESGVARAFKLLGMEYKSRQIEKVFKKGFYQRTELINDLIKFSTWNIITDQFTTEIEFKRDLPIDELSKLQIAEGLKRLGLSNETILRMLPGTMLKDPDKEIKAMEEADKKRQEDFANMLNGQNNQEGI